MQDLQARMLEAVLGGRGLQGLADLAATEAGGPVAIRLPSRGASVVSPEGALGIVVVPRLAGGGAALLLFNIAPDAAQPEPVDWVPEHLASPIKLAATSVGDVALSR